MSKTFRKKRDERKHKRPAQKEKPLVIVFGGKEVKVK